MLYDFYQATADIGDFARSLAAATGQAIKSWPAGAFSPWRQSAALCEAAALVGFSHARPAYAIASVEVAGETIPVVEETALSTPFCNLLRFRKARSLAEPKVLLVAPMSGHFATLLRGTARTLLRDHDLYLTDWVNPRDIPLEAGGFGFDDYTQHLIDFVKFMGPD
ncbi:MAG TPA: polyhydroxyalkanoate depolymerase, partial [Roseiarcus sp.]|nr:polyhydroxyalkanoate depolymerase [Roseiarcus sp.]